MDSVGQGRGRSTHAAGAWEGRQVLLERRGRGPPLPRGQGAIHAGRKRSCSAHNELGRLGDSRGRLSGAGALPGAGYSSPAARDEPRRLPPSSSSTVS
ncbi:hypothetical protein SEVIR_1G333032v4 [Setaria viridis]